MNNMKVKIIPIFLFLSVVVSSLQGQAPKDSAGLSLTGVGELGFLAVADHRVQFSQSGTYFDYRKRGGQDVLFPVSRLSLELNINDKHTIYVLYQPLRLETEVLLTEDLVVDEMTFPANTGVNLLYNFPFYRASYTRTLFRDNPRFHLELGGSLQLRNATISFESKDETQFRTNRDVGPVPALKLRTRAYLSENVFTELEADGIYAPVSYLNGSDNEVVGAILDASLRTSYEFDAPVSAFLNLRYLGGGAVGTSEVNGPGDGYVRNWLHFATVTVGFAYTLRAEG